MKKLWCWIVGHKYRNSRIDKCGGIHGISFMALNKDGGVDRVCLRCGNRKPIKHIKERNA